MVRAESVSFFSGRRVNTFGGMDEGNQDPRFGGSFGAVGAASVLSVFRQAKRLVIGVVGSAVLLVGLAMIVLPGPAFIVIPLGLGILATEFEWARNLLKKVKDKWRTGGTRTHKSRAWITWIYRRFSMEKIRRRGGEPDEPR